MGEVEIDEQVIEDIRASVRAELVERMRKAAANAVPRETKDWLAGFEAGVRHVVEAIED